MNLKFQRKVTAILAIFIAAILWGTTYPVVKIGLSVLTPPIPPLGYLFLRFSIALLVLIPFFPLLTSIQNLKSLLKDKFVILLGIVNATSYIFQFIGAKETTSGMATLMVNTYLISTPLITSYYLKIPLARKLKFSLILGALGVILSATGVIITDIPEGDIITFLISTGTILLSGLIWGGYAIVSSEFHQKSENKDRSHPIMIFAVSNFISVILIGVSMVITNQAPQLSTISADAWVSVLYLGLACTSLTYALYIFASKTISPTTINIVLLLNIIIGIILSVLLLGDTLSLLMIIGSLIIIVAIYIASKDEIVSNNQ
ncbi:MAG: DMT family transporter [Candidatus Hodarchaeales archaeon]